MIKTNLKEKIFESGIDIGSSEIKCTIVEIDSINESVKLIGIGRSKTKGLKMIMIYYKSLLLLIGKLKQSKVVFIKPWHQENILKKV